MNLNVEKVAADLIRIHGMEKARMEVLANALKAQREEDNFSLSVWRDVKRILGRQNTARPKLPPGTI